MGSVIYRTIKSRKKKKELILILDGVNTQVSLHLQSQPRAGKPTTGQPWSHNGVESA